ncbi:MAG: hypothetical protein CBARDMAM_6503 [uncultured Caballeronia sp.]|nr:MAG: hypothetical protein CBARDMAM_6503 [uncultured Caballeronia sp.]
MRLSETLDQACRLDPSSAGFALGVRSALDGLSPGNRSAIGGGPVRQAPCMVIARGALIR